MTNRRPIVVWQLVNGSSTNPQLIREGQGRDALQLAMSTAITELLRTQDGVARLVVDVEKRPPNSDESGGWR